MAMLLKIRTPNVLALINAENITYYKSNRNNKQILEISCKNTDIYMFTYQSKSKENFMKFKEFCENIVNIMMSKQDVYSCTLELEDVNFEKHSVCSYIED